MTAPASPGHRLGGVEGLRGIAAAGVLLGHVHLYASPDGRPYDLGWAGVVPRTSGTVGVVLFFTLSSFLLYRPFVTALLAGAARPSLRSYLRNRFLRVLPGYWLALLVAGLVLRSTYLPPLTADGRSLASEPAVLLANLLLVQGYSPATALTGIGPAWSLVVEMAFYLCLPVLAVGAGLLATRTAVGRRRPWAAALMPAVVLLVVGQLGWRLAYSLPGAGQGTWAGSWHAVVARSFLAHASLFAAGLVLAVVHAQMARGALRLPMWWRTAAWTTALAVGVPAVLAFDRTRISENRATLTFSVSCALLLALVVLPWAGRSPLLRILSSRPLQWSGLISYGVFLWNEPLVWFLQRQGWTSTGRLGFVIALIATAVLAGSAAVLSWRLVERPALSLKRPSAGAAERPSGAQVSVPLQNTGRREARRRRQRAA